MENNALGRKFSFWELFIFALPNTIMMLFLSLYVIVDGAFVSRFVGTTALSSINMTFPMDNLQTAIGVMLASGSSALIARKMGEGKSREAKENFTFIAVITFTIGIVIAVGCNVFIEPILSFLRVSEAQYDYCKTYFTILVSFSPLYLLQTLFQILFATAGKPQLGLLTTVIAGVSNIILDYLFIVVFKMGIAGAAFGTGIGYCIPSLFGLLYFTLNRKGSLHFVKFHIDLKMLLKSCSNGSSEMVSNIANGVTTFLFNIIFLKYFGVDGVASITIVLYFQFLFTAIYLGFSMGVSPIISYKYGSKDIAQLKQVFKNSMIFIGASALLSFFCAIVFITPALTLFAERGTEVFNITEKGFPIYSVSYIFMGISIFASNLFTALSNGRISAIISFLRTCLFLVVAIIVFPLLFGGFAVWFSVPVAEFLGVLVSIYYIISKRKEYNYL